MDKKLTLSLRSEIIERAKIYSHNNKISLSKLIESYLANLTSKSERQITPLVKSLSGVIDAKEVEKIKDDYENYLTEKYK